MAIIGFRCVLGDVPMEQHKKCMLGDAPCGYPATLLEQMGREKAERTDQGVVYSPSSISGCHRRYSLQKNHDWYVNPDQSYGQIRGNIIHAGLEKEPAPEGTVGVVRELRLHAPIQTRYGEKKFSGQIDEILLLRVEFDDRGSAVLHISLTDWKTKNDIPHSMVEADKRHVHQINDYAWLCLQVLALYLNNWEEMAPKEAKLYLGKGVDKLPHIDRVVVDEFKIVYMSMNKERTFVSDKIGQAKGKLLGEKDAHGHWHAYVPHEHEPLELFPVRMFSPSYTESTIRHGIEIQVESEEVLAPPLEGEDAKLMCPGCGVREVCITLGEAQGYNMIHQRVR